jgi:hypothetical protein
MNILPRQFGWWLTALLLGAGLVGWWPGLYGAMVLTAARAARRTLQPGGLRRLDAQVRVFYLGLLLLGVQPGLRWLHLAQWAGVIVLLVTDYCLAARLLMLLPWNRDEPLTLWQVSWLLLAPPGPRPIRSRWKAALRHERLRHARRPASR